MKLLASTLALGLVYIVFLSHTLIAARQVQSAHWQAPVWEKLSR